MVLQKVEMTSIKKIRFPIKVIMEKLGLENPITDAHYRAYGSYIEITTEEVIKNAS